MLQGWLSGSLGGAYSRWCEVGQTIVFCRLSAAELSRNTDHERRWSILPATGPGSPSHCGCYHERMDSRRMCPQCRAFITSKDRVCPYCNEPVGPRAIDRRSPSPILGGLIPHARFL